MRERRVPEGGLAADGSREVDAGRLVFRDLLGAPTFRFSRSTPGESPKGERAFGSAPRNWERNVSPLASITRRGLGPCLAVEGATTRQVFETYLERVLTPTLEPRQMVIMANPPPTRAGGLRRSRG